ncbi:methyltransferase domain-containing protein [uncultured Jatrophihabitans sp.]|uniref:methyltransferase domain-containing protein n=1 Tax=uncultured Jatrophihabitans sp. TaxID=1610747 RepID=UPI0035CA8CF2
MRQVVGKQTRDLDAAAFAQLRERYRSLVLDLGTGDGKHVLTVARAQPDALVVGLDAAPDAMRATAASAARKPARGGVPNALFVWASVEQLPAELAAVDDVHVLMPWGSLLRAVVAPDIAVLRGVRTACRTGATFLITLNLHAWRPPVPEVGALAEPTPDSVRDDLAPRMAEAGWVLEHVGYASAQAVAALGTSWTKRLGSSRDELAVLELRGTFV